MEQGHSAKLPKDLVDTASTACSGNEQCPQRQCLQSLQRTTNDFPSTPSCPYNSLHDKHLKGYFKRSNVREFLQKVGLIAEDGTVLQTKEEERLATKVHLLLAERELILRKLEQKERERLERLHKLAAKTNIEISADNLLLEKQANSIQETQRKLMLLRAQEGCSVQEMTPNDTSLSCEFKEKSVDEDTASKQFAAESSLPFDSESSCEGNSGMSSTCGSQSEAVLDPSTLGVRMRVLQAIEEENEQLKRAYHEQMLRQEEESLNIRLQYEQKRQSRAEKKLQQLEVLQAQKKVKEENTLKEEKMRLHQEIKRRIALETILKAVQEEERKAIVAARIKDEKQKIFELEQQRQTALCKAKIAANEQRKDCEREYEEALVLSSVTSPKSQPTQYNSGDRTGTSTSKQPRPPSSNADGAGAIPSQASQRKKPVEPRPRSVCEFVCLPGQADLDIVEEPPSKISMVNKETNTSLHLLKDIAHLIPKRTSSVQTAVTEEFGVDTGPVLTTSTASQTTPDGSEDTVPGRQPVEEEREEVFVEDIDYLEAVEEVQNSINQELLESAIKMSPQISEAVVEKVASLGPEALEVLEGIKSKLSSSVSQTAEQPRGPTPTPTPISCLTPTPSHKSVDPTDPFLSQSVSVRRSIPVNPTLESIAEDWILISDDDLEMGYGEFEGVIETECPEGPPEPVSSVCSTMAEQVIDAIFNKVVENPGQPFQTDKGWTSAVPPQLHQLSTDECVDNPSISSVHTTMCTIPAHRPTTSHSSRRSSSSHNLSTELKQSVSQETVSRMLTTSKSSTAMPSSASNGPTGLVEAVQSKTVDSVELSNVCSGKEQSSYSQNNSSPDNISCSTVSVGRKPSVQTSTVSVGRKPSVQTSTVSVGRKPSVQTSTVSVGHKPSVQSSTVSVGRKPSVQTSTVSVGRKPSVQTSTVSIGGKPSVQTSTVSIGHKPSVQSSTVSVGRKPSVQSSTVSVGRKPSVQTSTVSVGHKPSVQTSTVSIGRKPSVQTSTVSVGGKPSEPDNVHVDAKGSTVEPPTAIVVADMPTEDVAMDTHNDQVTTDILSETVAADEPTGEVTGDTHTIDSVDCVSVEQVTTNTFGEDVVEATSIVAVMGNTSEEATVSGLVEETASVIGVIETDKVILSDTTSDAPTETVTMETPTETVTMDTPSETVIIEKPMEKIATKTQYEEACMYSAPTAKDPVVDSIIRETDDCSEDPTAGICATGPNIDEEETPNKEAETDTPSNEADADNPTKEAETDTPSNEPDVDNPTKEAEVDTPSTEADVDDPTKEVETDTPSTEADVDNPTKEAEVDTPSNEADVDNSTKEAETDTPSNEPDVDNPTKEAETDTPSNEADVDNSTKEVETDTPSNEPDVDNSTKEAETDTPSNEADVDNPTKEVDTNTPIEEVDTDIPSKEADTDTPTEEEDTDTPSKEADTDSPTKEVDADTPTKEVDADTPTTVADTDKSSKEVDSDTHSKVSETDTPTKEADQGTPDEAPVLPEVSADSKEIACEKSAHSTKSQIQSTTAD